MTIFLQVNSRMHLWYRSILFFTCLLAGGYGKEEGLDLHVLDDDSFEHLTQASTGATTGDWLILMTKDKKCSDCKKIEKELRKVALTYENRKNVAVLDTEKSPLTLKRFQVSKKPQLMFFRNGYQWTYKGDLKKHDKISAFVGEKYQEQTGHRVTPPIDSMDIWKEEFAKEVMAALKEKRLPKGDALLVLSGGVLAVLMLLYGLVCSSKRREEEEEEEIRQKKDQ